MPLVLAPSFDDHSRQQVEEHLELVRIRRIAAALEYQQSKMMKLTNEDNVLVGKLRKNYEMLGNSLKRLDNEINKCELYLQNCQMLKDEMGLVLDRIELAKR